MVTSQRFVVMKEYQDVFDFRFPQISLDICLCNIWYLFQFGVIYLISSLEFSRRSFTRPPTLIPVNFLITFIHSMPPLHFVRIVSHGQCVLRFNDTMYLAFSKNKIDKDDVKEWQLAIEK